MIDPTPLPDTTLLVTCASGREGDARRELRGLLPGAEVRPLFLKGNMLVHVPLGLEEALARVRDADTQFVARFVPLQLELRIGKPREHLDQLAAAAALLRDRLGPGDTFRVTCKRRGQHEFRSQDVERAVGLHLEGLGATVDLHCPSHVLSVEIFQDIAFVGLCRAEELLVREITRARKYAPGERPLNRAEWKLREALRAFAVELPPGGRALDLGAAPGGWSKVLAEAGVVVVAVDPAALDPEVAANPLVTHLATHADDRAAIEPFAPFALITNDMNRDPRESAEMVRDLVPLLAPEGAVIMTVKFMTARRKRHLQEARAALEPLFGEITERRLPHNAHETTLCLRGRR